VVEGGEHRELLINLLLLLAAVEVSFDGSLGGTVVSTILSLYPCTKERYARQAYVSANASWSLEPTQLAVLGEQPTIRTFASQIIMTQLRKLYMSPAKLFSRGFVMPPHF
jgi:hypothetical protein